MSLLLISKYFVLVCFEFKTLLFVRLFSLLFVFTYLWFYGELLERLFFLQFWTRFLEFLEFQKNRVKLNFCVFSRISFKKKIKNSILESFLAYFFDLILFLNVLFRFFKIFIVFDCILRF